MECPPGAPHMAQEAPTCLVHGSLQVQAQTLVRSTC